MLIKEIIVFTVPLFIAGFLHHFFIIQYNLVSLLVKPIDFGLAFGNRRLFGDSKTWRGFTVMTFATGFFMWLINLFFNIPLRQNAFVCGSLLGFGYSLGELPNSFLKRRLRIKEAALVQGFLGALFRFLDQTDSIIGALIFLNILYLPSTILVFILFLIGTLLHVLVDAALYKFSYKQNLVKTAFKKRA